MGIFNAILGNASEVNIDNVAKEFQPILIPGEAIEKAFKLIRDMFIFTNKRLHHLHAYRLHQYVGDRHSGHGHRNCQAIWQRRK